MRHIDQNVRCYPAGVLLMEMTIEGIGPFCVADLPRVVAACLQLPGVSLLAHLQGLVTLGSSDSATRDLGDPFDGHPRFSKR